MTILVVIVGRLHDGVDPKAFEAVFKQVSRTILSSIPGINKDELVRDTNDPNMYMLLSEWESKKAWSQWQSAPIHEQQVKPLQQYWKGQEMKICETAFSISRK